MGKGIARNWGEREKRIVEMYFILGIPKGEIAQSVGIPKKSVDSVLQDPRTTELVEAVRKRILEETAKDITQQVGDKLDELRVHAVKSLETTLTAEITATHKSKPNQDRVAMKVLQGTGDLRDRSERDHGGITLTENQFDRLLEGLAKADRVSEQDRVLPAEVIEENE